MADGGPPAPQPPPVAPPVVPPFPPMQPSPSPTKLAVQPIQPALPQVQPGPIPQLNRSHFKPEFTENQMKMQMHIFSGQMIGWTLMHFQRV